jgi:gamma-glutamyltranspeptidase/glutathione hydrolase/leukotriene-C4 hydrolase
VFQDSAITTCLCIGTLNSFSSGLGGGGFMVIRAPPQSSTSNSLPWSTTPTYTQPSDSPYLVNFTSITDPKSLEKSTLIAIDFRETAPALSDPQMYVKAPAGSSQVGGLSIGVPGELRGLYTAYEMYGSGRVEWSDLVQPVVELAKGWRVSRELARRFRIYGSKYGF